MNEHDIALKKFADASADAFEAIISAMSDEQRDYIVRLFQVGNSVAMAHTIGPTGDSQITFEVIFSDGKRRVLASVVGQSATLQ